jgi:AcrR family transcriptional regulator
MARTAGSSGVRTAAAIRESALSLIHRRGFAAMSLRDLAAEVGIRPGSLYNHITTKQALLFDLVHGHMCSLIESADLALEASGPDTMARLRAFIAHHLAYHFERRREVYVANSELRALEPPNRAAVMDLRRAYEDRLIALLEAGVAEGSLRLGDTRIAAYAILAMLTGVCTWYRPNGRFSKQALIAQHVALVLEGAGRSAGASRQPRRLALAVPTA